MSLMIALTILIVIGFIVIITSYAFIFKHTGEPVSSAFVPFYNTYVLYRMFWNPRLYMITMASTILSNIPFRSFDPKTQFFISLLINSVAFVMNMTMLLHLSRAYHMSKLFGVLLMFFPYILLPVIAKKKELPDFIRKPKQRIKKEKVPIVYLPSDLKPWTGKAKEAFSGKKTSAAKDAVIQNTETTDDGESGENNA